MVPEEGAVFELLHTHYIDWAFYEARVYRAHIMTTEYVATLLLVFLSIIIITLSYLAASLKKEIELHAFAFSPDFFFILFIFTNILATQWAICSAAISNTG